MNEFIQTKTMLIGMGAQRSGSSWLYMQMQNHPDIQTTPIKEMHFFGNRADPKGGNNRRFPKRLLEPDAAPALQEALSERCAFDGQIEPYRYYFERRNQGESIICEMTPAYAYLPLEELRFIQQSFPNLKLLFTLRDPVARLWSSIKFRNKGQSADAWRDIARHALTKPFYQMRSDYKETILRLEQVFAPEQIFFNFFETQFQDQALSNLSNWLGIEPFPNEDLGLVNDSPLTALDGDIAQMFFEQLAGQYEFAREKFGDQVPDLWLA